MGNTKTTHTAKKNPARVCESLNNANLIFEFCVVADVIKNQKKTNEFL